MLALGATYPLMNERHIVASPSHASLVSMCTVHRSSDVTTPVTFTELAAHLDLLPAVDREDS